ncbi:hypothetical protein CGLO_13417 [Colletotrichum gloeosporioides Cg-14]|uniref:Uncharacterized protein n=1 Tax=Colletotrichum gloeosporioides (strain Cg-14) TaxID=1237896 RepID=T0K661_COLGC|nr:hypothetical protein CGLO_13417 [Colletotrichum gloeosporioides Cg-14]
MDPGDWVEENCPWLFDGFCPCHWHDRGHHDYGFCPSSGRKPFKLVKYTDTQEGNFTQMVVGDSNYAKLFSAGEAQGETRSEIHGAAQTLGLDGLDGEMLGDNIDAQKPPNDRSADTEGVSTGEAHGQTQNDDVHDEETQKGFGPIVEYVRAQESAEDSEQHYLT